MGHCQVLGWLLDITGSRPKLGKWGGQVAAKDPKKNRFVLVESEADRLLPYLPQSYNHPILILALRLLGIQECSNTQGRGVRPGDAVDKGIRWRVLGLGGVVRFAGQWTVAGCRSRWKSPELQTHSCIFQEMFIFATSTKVSSISRYSKSPEASKAAGEKPGPSCFRNQHEENHSAYCSSLVTAASSHVYCSGVSCLHNAMVAGLRLAQFWTAFCGPCPMKVGG